MRASMDNVGCRSLYDMFVQSSYAAGIYDTIW